MEQAPDILKVVFNAPLWWQFFIMISLIFVGLVIMWNGIDFKFIKINGVKGYLKERERQVDIYDKTNKITKQAIAEIMAQIPYIFKFNDTEKGCPLPADLVSILIHSELMVFVDDDHLIEKVANHKYYKKVLKSNITRAIREYKYKVMNIEKDCNNIPLEVKNFLKNNDEVINKIIKDLYKIIVETLEGMSKKKIELYDESKIYFKKSPIKDTVLEKPKAKNLNYIEVLRGYKDE